MTITLAAAATAAVAADATAVIQKLNFQVVVKYGGHYSAVVKVERKT